MRSGVHVAARCPSVCPVAAGGAAMRQPGRRQLGCSSTALRSKCGQCRVYSRQDAAEHTLVGLASAEIASVNIVRGRLT